VLRIFPVVLILIGGWLGARLPLTDIGYLDLAQGRQIAERDRLTPPDTILGPAGPEQTSGWLGSWILFSTHRAGGVAGLRALAAICVATGALLLYLVRPGGAGFVVAAAAVSLAASTLDLSTSLFSWPLVALVVFCWSTLRPKNKWWVLLLLLPLASWPFLNREAMVGFALALLAIGTSLVAAIRVARGQEHAESRLADFQEPSLLGAVLVTALMSVLLTSSGQDLLGNPFREAPLLGEAGAPGWQAVSLAGDAMYFLLAALLGLLALTAPPLAMPFETLASAGFLALSLTSRHFVLFFAAVAVPAAVWALVRIGEPSGRFARSVPRMLRARGTALMIGIALVLPAATRTPQPHPFADAARHLANYGVDQRLFNLPPSGGVSSWSGGPERRPFTYLRSGSIEAFQREAMEKTLAEIFADHDLELALISRDFANQRADELSGLKGLRLLYFDETALLYTHSDTGSDGPSEATFNYFDPLLSPSDYPEETVPLAIQELFQYVDQYAPSSTTLWKLGRLLLRAERPEEALEAFEAAHRLNVEDPAVLRELTRLYIEKGMYGLAERSARRALRVTRDEELVYNLALSLYGQARYVEAAGEFEAVVDLNGENLQARRALRDIYQQLGELEQSYLQKQALDALVESKTAELLSLAGERHAALDFAGEADVLQQALDVNRDNPDLLWNLAMVLLTDERVPEAMNVLRALLDVAPRHTEARLTLGVLCFDDPSCETDEAKLHLEAFLELSPEDINAELAIARLDRLE